VVISHPYFYLFTSLLSCYSSQLILPCHIGCSHLVAYLITSFYEPLWSLSHPSNTSMNLFDLFRTLRTQRFQNDTWTLATHHIIPEDTYHLSHEPFFKWHRGKPYNTKGKWLPQIRMQCQSRSVASSHISEQKVVNCTVHISQQKCFAALDIHHESRALLVVILSLTVAAQRMHYHDIRGWGQNKKGEKMAK
jgi:hypothetical protein